MLYSRLIYITWGHPCLKILEDIALSPVKPLDSELLEAVFLVSFLNSSSTHLFIKLGFISDAYYVPSPVLCDTAVGK